MSVYTSDPLVSLPHFRQLTTGPHINTTLVHSRCRKSTPTTSTSKPRTLVPLLTVQERKKIAASMRSTARLNGSGPCSCGPHSAHDADDTSHGARPCSAREHGGQHGFTAQDDGISSTRWMNWSSVPDFYFCNARGQLPSFVSTTVLGVVWSTYGVCFQTVRRLPFHRLKHSNLGFKRTTDMPRDLGLISSQWSVCRNPSQSVRQSIRQSLRLRKHVSW
jgi:hypothetical protein